MKIKFGEQVLEKEEALSVFEAASELELASRATLCAVVNGEVKEMTYVLTEDADVRLCTFEDEEGKKVFRHTAAHVLAQAVKRLYPQTKLTIGPAIDGGFYYDFDSDVSFTPDILKALEDEMKITIIAAGFDKDEEENTAEAEQQTATAESNIEDIFSKLM